MMTSPPSPSLHQAMRTPNAEAMISAAKIADSSGHGVGSPVPETMPMNSQNAATNEPVMRAIQRTGFAVRLALYSLMALVVYQIGQWCRTPIHSLRRASRSRRSRPGQQDLVFIVVHSSLGVLSAAGCLFHRLAVGGNHLPQGIGQALTALGHGPALGNYLLSLHQLAHVA